MIIRSGIKGFRVVPGNGINKAGCSFSPEAGRKARLAGSPDASSEDAPLSVRVSPSAHQ